MKRAVVRREVCLWLLISAALPFVALLACGMGQGQAGVLGVVYKDGNNVAAVQKVSADAENGILVAGALFDGSGPTKVKFLVNGSREKAQGSDAATRGQLLDAIETNLSISGAAFDSFAVVESENEIDLEVGDFIRLEISGLLNLGDTVAVGAALKEQLELGTPPVSPVQFTFLDVRNLPFLATGELGASLITATPHAGGNAVTVVLEYDNPSSVTLFDVFGILTKPIGDAVLLNADEGPGGITLTPEGADGTSDGEIQPGEDFQMSLTFSVTGIPDPAADPKQAQKAALKFGRKVERTIDVLAFDSDQPDQTISVDITSPLLNSTTSTAAVLVSGTAGGVNEVIVNGITVPVTGGVFGTTLSLSEGRSRIYATATTSAPPALSVADTVQVTVDTKPPRVTLSSPAQNQLVTNFSLNVAGNVLDADEEVVVSVGGQQTAADQNGTFLVPAISLSPGSNTIVVTATDRTGNATTTTTAVFFDPNPSSDRVSVVSGNLQEALVNTLLPQPFEVVVTDAADSPITGVPVTFRVVRGDSTFDGVPPAEARRTIVPTDGQGIAQVALALGALAGPGAHQVQASVTSTVVVADFLITGLPHPAVSLHQTGDASTFRPVVPGQFNAALTGETFTLAVIATDQFGNQVPNVDVDFAVTLGGGSFGGSPTMTTSTNAVGLASADFTVGDIVGALNEVTVDFIGNGGLPVRFTFDPVAPGDPGQTIVSGRVLDQGLNPISGAMVTAATSTAATLSDGSFMLAGVPPGTALVDVQAPGFLGVFEFANITLRMDTRPGVENALPWLIVPIKGANETLIGPFDVVVRDSSAEAEVMVAANSVFVGGVTTSTASTLRAVPNDQLPGALPRGESTVVTLLLTPLGLEFNPPAPVSVPNAEELPAGSTVRFYVFGDNGSFEIGALGEVSADGSTVKTLPSMGITSSGLIAVAASPQSPTSIVENPAPGSGAIALGGSFVISGANAEAGVGGAGDFELIVPAFSSRLTATALAVRVRTAGAGGVTGHTDFFDLTPGSSTAAPDFFPTSVTGQPLSLIVTSTASVLSPGQTAQIDVTGFLVDNTTRDLSLRADGTVYLSTNPFLVDVSQNGTIFASTDALFQGSAAPEVFIMAVNDGRWAASRFQIVPDSEMPVITQLAVVPDPAVAGQGASLLLDGSDNVAIVAGDVEVTATTATTTVVVLTASFTGAPPYSTTFSVPADALTLLVSASVADAATNTTFTAAVVAVEPPPDTTAPVITQLAVVPDPAVAGQGASLLLDGSDNVGIVMATAEVTATTATTTVVVLTTSFTGAPPYSTTFSVPADALTLLVSASVADAATNTTFTAAVVAVEPPPDTTAPVITQLAVVPDPAVAGQGASLLLDGSDNVGIVMATAEVTATTATTTVVVLTTSFTGAPPYSTTFSVPADALTLLVSASVADAATNTTFTAAVVAVEPPPDTTAPVITQLAVVPDPAMAGQGASLIVDGTDNVAIVAGDVEVTATTATTTVVVLTTSFTGAPPYSTTFNVPADALTLLVSASVADAATNTTFTAAVVAVEPPPDTTAPVITQLAVVPNPAVAGQGASLLVDGSDNVGIVTGTAEVTATTATTTLVVLTASFTGAPPYSTTFNVPADALTLLVSASVADAATNTTFTAAVVAVEPPPDTTAPVITQLAVVPNPAVAGQGASLLVDGSDNVGIVTGTAEVTATTATTTVVVLTASFTGAPPYSTTFSVPADALSLLVSASVADAATNTTFTAAVVAVEPPPDTTAPLITQLQVVPDPAVAGQGASLLVDGSDNVGIVTGTAEVTATTATTTVVVLTTSFTGAPPYSTTFSVPADALSLLVSASVADAATNTTFTAAVVAVEPPPDTTAPVITQLAVVPDPAVAGQGASLIVDGTDNVAIVAGDVEVTATTATTTVVVLTTSFTGAPPYSTTFSVPADALSLLVSASVADAATNTTFTAAVVAVEPPAAGPPVAVGEFFAAPPTQTMTYDVSTNDTFDAATAFFVLITPPPVPPELFTWNGDGTFSLSLPTFQFTASLTYLISDANGTSTAVSVQLSVSPSLLTTGVPVFLEDGVEKASVPTLDIDGLRYPLYQLILARGDACPPAHYHRSALVFSIEQPTTAITDPNPPGCGFGTHVPAAGETQRVQVVVVIPKMEWDAFLADPVHTAALPF